jgi:hypothetical protein
MVRCDGWALRQLEDGNRRLKHIVADLSLDSPRLNAARKKKWPETLEWSEEYHESCPDDIDACT